MQIQEPKTSSFPLFNLGFRPFFLGAGLFAVISVSLWLAYFLNLFTFPNSPISAVQWHAHEMIYGYSMAVIAGFLLTAVRNWTGLPTPSGWKLVMLFALWAVARVLFSLEVDYLVASAICDLLFNSVLLVVLSRPIIQSKQHKQFAVTAKLFILLIGNLFFYLGALGKLENGLLWGIYGGLYTVVGLVLTIGRRVMPFFIERAAGGELTLFNSKWLDLISLFGLLGFLISELFTQTPALSATLAIAIAAVNGIRLLAWHHTIIWQRSLLWSLYLALWFICLGFILFALNYFANIPKHLAVHALAYGGIGLATLSMMSRVALGHTGRNIHKPAKLMIVALSLFILGTLIRVLLPLTNAFNYASLIQTSQVLWIVAFVIFTCVYLPVLTQPRADGRPD